MRAESLLELAELMSQADGPDVIGFDISRDFEIGEWVAIVKRVEPQSIGRKEAMTNRDYALEEFFRTERVGDRETLIGLAEGEIPNGARIVKVNSEPGDGHQDGAMGTVMGALEANEEVRAELRRRGVKQIEWIYWIKFDDLPEVPVAIADYRIKRQEDYCDPGN